MDNRSENRKGKAKVIGIFHYRAEKKGSNRKGKAKVIGIFHYRAEKGSGVF